MVSEAGLWLVVAGANYVDSDNTVFEICHDISYINARTYARAHTHTHIMKPRFPEDRVHGRVNRIRRKHGR